MRNRTKVTILAVLAMLVIAVVVAVQPVLACYEGCTPGFWKQEQHFYAWPDALCVDTDKAPPNWTFYKPIAECTGDIVPLGVPPQDYLVQDLFTIPGCLLTNGDLDLNEDGYPDTLLDALNYQGGDSVKEKAEILLRAAVAGVLNGMTMLHQAPGPIVTKVEAALNKACDTGNFNTLLYWAMEFDRQNNQYCVFSPDGINYW